MMRNLINKLFGKEKNKDIEKKINLIFTMPSSVFREQFLPHIQRTNTFSVALTSSEIKLMTDGIMQDQKDTVIFNYSGNSVNE